MNQAMDTVQSSPAESFEASTQCQASRTSGPRNRMEHRWRRARAGARQRPVVHCAKWDAAGQIRDASLSGAFVHTRLRWLLHGRTLSSSLSWRE